jgi:hypothetical protein
MASVRHRIADCFTPSCAPHNAIKNDGFNEVKKLAFRAEKATFIKQNDFWLGTGGDTCRLHV